MSLASFRIALIAAGFYGALGIGLGAAAAHGLQSVLGAKELGWVEIASRYLAWHSLLLAALSALTLKNPPRSAMRLLIATKTLIITGVLLFCGSLLALAFGAPRGLASLAPFGGGSIILGWLLLLAVGIVWTQDRITSQKTSSSD